MKLLILFCVSLAVVIQTSLSAPKEAVAWTIPVGPSSAPKSDKLPTVARSSATSTANNSDPTSCAYRRQAELNSNSRLPGKLVPECRPDGKFASLQCHGEAVGGGRFCQCWDPEGNIIKSPSKKTKACDCLLQKHQYDSKKQKPIGAFVPKCDESGHFAKHQCHGSTGLCWCVHPANGTQIGEKGRGLQATSCA